MKIKILISLLTVSIIFSGCSQVPDSSAYQPSKELPDYQQNNFDQYVKETREWLEKNRVYLTDAKQTELDANTPFEMRPTGSGRITRGILLVHGLSDSPFYFRDIGQALAEQGFLVRSILLPGHGSRPADLMLPVYRDWQAAVGHHTQLLSQQVDEVWLGGFSTGGNLVTSQALQDDGIAGLLLFSPGFKPISPAMALVPVVNLFTDWADYDEPDKNYTRYGALAMNGASLYYRSSRVVRDALDRNTYDKPVLITISEDDSVISPTGVVELFQRRFTHPKSRLIWLGGTPQIGDSRIINLEESIPELKVSNFSHMSVLFAPDNVFYGQDSDYRMCENGQLGATDDNCLSASDIWYSAWGYREPGKYHARLTWNPYFHEVVESIHAVTNMN